MNLQNAATPAGAFYLAAMIVMAAVYPASSFEQDIRAGCLQRGTVSPATCECNAREAANRINFLNAPLYAIGLMSPDTRALLAICR